jgi:hypothetical protein
VRAAAAIILVSFSLLAGCATGGGGQGGTLALGDYEKQDEAALAASFAAQVNARYAKGSALAAATADLARNKFSCAAPKASGGSPPAQVCRRPVKAGGCDHTWQVHLFAGQAGTVESARGLYDRACGADDLLGK